ncbi:myosin-2-like [Ipomoea triloba]|uniref:myosin-2-like n=1 Tax=Ipomoea triloba TaxID=35885 RepID=UPI00125D1C8F|nr:myosin-2-like [Ipomoea triloba]
MLPFTWKLRYTTDNATMHPFKFTILQILDLISVAPHQPSPPELPVADRRRPPIPAKRLRRCKPPESRSSPAEPQPRSPPAELQSRSTPAEPVAKHSCSRTAAGDRPSLKGAPPQLNRRTAAPPEYELDGIDWRKVEFEDNQACLDLIEQKPIGLIALLDEESNFPKATDLTFTNKLKEHLKTNQCLKGERGGAFSIRHYAGEVLYSASGFLEKNRDLLHSDIVRLLSSCSSQLLQLFISYVLNQSQKSSPTTKLAVQMFGNKVLLKSLR